MPELAQSAAAVEPDRDETEVERYAASYYDLCLWLSRSGDAGAIGAHMATVGRTERVLPAAGLRPDDWSDTLYRTLCQDPDLIEMLRLGVARSGYDHAVAHYGAGAPALGRVSAAPKLVQKSQLPAAVLGQCVALDRRLAAWSPLATLVRDMPHVHGVGEPVIVPAMAALRASGAFDQHVDVAIIVPWLETGGAELGAYWFYRGAEALGLSAVLILTQSATTTRFFAEQNLRVINLPRILDTLAPANSAGAGLDVQKLLLHLVLDRLAARIVHLVHSWVGYNLLADLALDKHWQLAPKVLVSAFCPHIHADGRVDGYFRHIPQIDAAVAGYLCDSFWYRDQIAVLYAIEAERAQVVPYPTALAPLPARPERDGGPARVLWASRLDFQKNPAIVFAIARALPHITFEMYGRRVLNDTTLDWSMAPPNAVYRGEFFAFGELPLEQYFAFLYTSRFDGMPNIVLEAAAHGIPIISSGVGGVPEFLSGGAGLIVPDALDVAGYVQAITELSLDDDLAVALAAEARARIETGRSFDSFVGALAAVPLYREVLQDRSTQAAA